MLTVGVIIPVYKRTEFLHDALQSLYNQTQRPDQVVVISNVQLPKNCEKFWAEDNIIFVNTRIQSLAGKVNYVAEFLHTDTMFILCDDDMVKPTFIEETTLMMECCDYDVVYTDKEMIGNDPRIVKALDWTLENFTETTVPFITALVKKSVWDGVGGFENVQFSDWNFWWSCFDAGYSAFHINEPLFVYRTHLEQDSRNLSFEWVEQCRWVCREKHLERLKV